MKVRNRLASLETAAPDFVKEVKKVEKRFKRHVANVEWSYDEDQATIRFKKDFYLTEQPLKFFGKTLSEAKYPMSLLMERGLLILEIFETLD